MRTERRLLVCLQMGGRLVELLLLKLLLLLESVRRLELLVHLGYGRIKRSLRSD